MYINLSTYFSVYIVTHIQIMTDGLLIAQTPVFRLSLIELAFPKKV